MRGDELVRLLAKRLVEVDLLDQAAELLRHQVDNRLKGGRESPDRGRSCGDLPDGPQGRRGIAGAEPHPAGQPALDA
ncbi:hypothetical protein QW131_13795 [Roseibium salinum]|nr:hypothetical protein [Roseibium salinum]